MKPAKKLKLFDMKLYSYEINPMLRKLLQSVTWHKEIGRAVLG